MKRRRRCGSRLRRFLFPLRDEKPGIEFELWFHVVEVALSILKVHPVYLLTSRSTCGSTWHFTEQSLQMLAFDRSALRSCTTRGQLSFERERGSWVRGDFEDYLFPVISSTPSHTLRTMSTIVSPRASGATIGTLQPKRRVVQADSCAARFAFQPFHEQGQ